jgi:uncharacterized metal-binding protein YceD (DUF177 family)
MFEWTIGGNFFAGYEMSEIGDAKIGVHLTLVKHVRFLELHFVLNGWAEANCDRCLDPVRLDVASEARMLVTLGDHGGENGEGDDVIVLPSNEERLDVAQHLYEYAHLSLPARRVHPDGVCNADMIRSLKQYLVYDRPN